jgi:hypothetical protein
VSGWIRRRGERIEARTSTALVAFVGSFHGVFVRQLIEVALAQSGCIRLMYQEGLSILRGPVGSETPKVLKLGISNCKVLAQYRTRHENAFGRIDYHICPAGVGAGRSDATTWVPDNKQKSEK